MTARRFFGSTIKVSGGPVLPLINYSLRQSNGALSSDLVLRVRRESDNTELDIGFVSGQIDHASISSFCGASRGFVRSFYNLGSLPIDLHQTSNSLQPLIYDGSSFFTYNSRYYIDFNYQNSFLESDLYVDAITDNPIRLSSVIKTRNSLGIGGIFEENNTPSAVVRNILLEDTRSNRLGYIDSAGVSETYLFSSNQDQNTNYIYSFDKKNDSENSIFYVNNVIQSSQISTGFFLENNMRIRIGRQTAGTNIFFKGQFGEIIIYSANDFSLNELIDDQNLYYSIY